MFRNNKYRNTTIMAKYTQKNICSSHIFVCTKNYISFSDWSCYLNWFVMGFSHGPEHIVTKYGIKMVASVHSFLDEQVEYYEYKNWFFYGQNLGYEYYGSGGNDPLAQKPKPDPVRFTFYDLDGHVIESKGIN